MLISSEYKAEQQAMHAKGNYGTASLSFGRAVSELIDQTEASTLLDYGCGSMQNLAKVLRPRRQVSYRGYDPAVPDFSEAPEPADLVTCIDVLEHIEPDCLDDVLSHLALLTEGHGFFTIHTGPAVKVLSDGRNAHLIQQPGAWWFAKLAPLFDILTYQKLPSGCFVILEAR